MPKQYPKTFLLSNCEDYFYCGTTPKLAISPEFCKPIITWKSFVNSVAANNLIGKSSLLGLIPHHPDIVGWIACCKHGQHFNYLMKYCTNDLIKYCTNDNLQCLQHSSMPYVKCITGTAMEGRFQILQQIQIAEGMSHLTGMEVN